MNLNKKYYPTTACFDGQNIDNIDALRQYFIDHGVDSQTNTKQLSSCMYHIVYASSNLVGDIFSRKPRPAYRRLLITYNTDHETAKNIALMHKTKVAVINPGILSSSEAPVIFGFLCTGEDLVIDLSNQHSSTNYYVEEVKSDQEQESIKKDLTSLPTISEPFINDKQKQDEARIALYIKSFYKKNHTPNISPRRVLKKTARTILVFLTVLICSHFLALFLGGLLLFSTISNNKPSDLPIRISSDLFNYSLNVFKPLTLLFPSSSIRNYERFLNAVVDVSSNINRLSASIENLKKISLSASDGGDSSKTMHLILVQTESLASVFQQSVAMLQAEAKALLGQPDNSVNYNSKNINSQLFFSLNRIQAYSGTVKNIASLYKLLFPLGQDKRYLVLFQNSNELRPTGGFIGSLGILNMNGGVFKSLEIDDVYTIDGQLKGHVDPPLPIRTILNQEHWFLRDSNWDPDFEESAKKALWFYEKSTQQQLDGVIGFSLPLIEDLLEELGPLKVVGLDGVVDAKNFSSLVQNEIEDSFFPGSTRKKDILNELQKSVLEKLRSSNLPYLKLLTLLHNGLSRGELVFYSNDQDAQLYAHKSGWAGKHIFPDVCGQLTSCLQDGLGIVEANLSVDKLNKNVTRDVKRQIDFQEKGGVKIEDKITIHNTSTPGDDKAGSYTTYVRVYYPRSVQSLQVKINGSPLPFTESSMSAKPMPYIENIIENPAFKIVGVGLVVKPQDSAEIYTEFSRTFPDLKHYAFAWLQQPGTGEVPFLISGSTGFSFTPRLSHQKPGLIGTLVAKNGFFEYTTSMSTNNWFVLDIK